MYRGLQVGIGPVYTGTTDPGSSSVNTTGSNGGGGGVNEMRNIYFGLCLSEVPLNFRKMSIQSVGAQWSASVLQEN